MRMGFLERDRGWTPEDWGVGLAVSDSILGCLPQPRPDPIDPEEASIGMRWLATASFLETSLLQWAIAAGIALAVFLTLLLLRRLIVGRLGRRAALTPGGLDDIAVDLARRTRTLLILIPAVWLGSLKIGRAHV